MNGPFRLLLPLFIAIVAVAALFRLVPKAPRRRLRRSVILFGLYAVLLGVANVLVFAEAGSALDRVHCRGETLEILLIVNLALALFDLLAPPGGWNYPDILHDITVRAAYLVASAG
jgi:hypothetical protein